MGNIKSGTTTSGPFGLGETFQTRTDDEGTKGVGRTGERAQKDLEDKQAKNKS